MSDDINLVDCMAPILNLTFDTWKNDLVFKQMLADNLISAYIMAPNLTLITDM